MLRYSQEEKRVRNHDAPKDSIRVSSPLSQGIMKIVIPCSSPTICCVNIQSSLLLALKTETSMSHEKEKAESTLESKNKLKYILKFPSCTNMKTQ